VRIKRREIEEHFIKQIVYDTVRVPKKGESGTHLIPTSPPVLMINVFPLQK
jgi:hypothetical protein